MELIEWKQRYTKQKAEAEGGLLGVEAEAKRLTAVVHRLEGAIMAIDNLEQEEADELKKKLEKHTPLSEEDIQRALRDNQAELDSPPPEPKPSKGKGRKPKPKK